MNSFFSKITTIAAALMVSIAAFAQPSWNRVDYTATMAFIGEVKINQFDETFPRVVQENDYIGAFVGEECRMIAKVVSYNSALYVSSVIHGGDMFLSSNTEELLEFKLWNSSANAEVARTIKGTLLSLPNGEIFTYIIGQPNENVEVQSLEVANRSLNLPFSNEVKNYEIEFEAGADLPTNDDITVVLADKRAKYNVELPTDFTENNKLIVTVVAEDEETEAVFTITCTQSTCAVLAPEVENADLQFCVGDAAKTLTAIGTNLQWYDSDEKLLSKAPTVNTAIASENTYSVTQTTTCESAKAHIKVTVNALPTVSIVADKSTVLDTETIALTLIPEVGGVLSGSTGVVGLTFDPSKSEIGVQTLVYTYEENGCENKDEVTITVKKGVIEKPTLENTIVEVVVNAPSPILNAEAEGTITWYDEDKNKIDTGESFSPNINTEKEGEYIYYVSNTVDGEESELVEITVTVSSCSTPMPTVVNKQQFCVGDAAKTLTASGTSLRWYDGDEKLLSKAPTISTAIASENTYFVTQTTTCESAKARITVVVNALPAVSIEAEKTIVLNTETLALTLVPAVGGTLSGSSGVSGLTFDPALAPFGKQILTYSYTDANNCKNSDDVTITVKDANVAKPVISETEYRLIIGDDVPTITAEGENLRWLNQTGTQVGSGTSFIPAISTDVEGRYQFMVVNTKDDVDSEPIVITITITECAATPPVLLHQRVLLCQGDVPSDLNSFVIGENLKWYDGITELTATPVPNTTSSGVKVYSVSQRTNCESQKETLIIEVVAKPVVSIFASANEMCTTEKISIQLLPAGGTFEGPGTMFLSEFTPDPSAIGKQTLSYTYTDKNNCSDTKTTSLTIKSCPVGGDAETITIVDKPILAIGEAYPMQMLVNPAGAFVRNVVWTVNNPAIAEIDENTGVIIGKAAGLVVVRVKAQIATDKTISNFITMRIVAQPIVTNVAIDYEEQKVIVTFSERMRTPKNEIMYDVQIFDGIKECVIYDVAVNPQNEYELIFSFADAVVNVNNVRIKYVGTSIASITGALVGTFEKPILNTSISTIENREISVYPTIASSEIMVETTSKIDNIAVVNNQGQIVLAQIATMPITQLSVANLMRGNYTIIVFSNNKIVGTARFVKK